MRVFLAIVLLIQPFLYSAEADLTVSSAGELSTALSSASGGETILLESGNYGDFSVTGRPYSLPVRITSADGAGGGVFTTLTIDNCENLVFDSVHVSGVNNGVQGTGFVNILGCDAVSFINSEVNGTVDSSYAISQSRFVSSYGIEVNEGGSDIVVENNFIHHVENGVVCFGIRHLTVRENVLEDLRCDSMKFGGVTHTLIENNFAATRVHPVPDDHVDFIQFQGSGTDVTIRGNIMLPEDFAGKVYQGIFLNDADFQNFTIEDNLIYTNTVNAIFIGSEEYIDGPPAGDNIVIRYNTVLSPPDATIWNNADIRIVKLAGSYTVEHNVTDRVILNDGSGIDNGNYELQWEHSDSAEYYNDYYVNAAVGSGAVIEDFMPVSGSPADGEAGAFKRINELLDGNSDDTGNEDDPLDPDINTQDAETEDQTFGCSYGRRGTFLDIIILFFVVGWFIKKSLL